MPLLARTVNTPLAIDVRRGAIADLGALLADRRISAGGDVAVVVGPGQGERIARAVPARRSAGPTSSPSPAAPWTPRSTSARSCARRLLRRGGRHRRRQDHRHRQVRRLPLRHPDGVAWRPAWPTTASPRRPRRLDHDGGTGSYGVHIPIAVVVDLDFVENGPDRQTQAGIGDALSNLNAIADWELAHQVRGEPIDGLAVTLARVGRRGAAQPPRRDHRRRLPDHARRGADPGRARHGGLRHRRRPASGGCHEISHAIDQLYPGTASHGEQVGLGALFCTFLRGDERRFAAARRLPAPARAAAHARRPRADRRAVRRRGRRSRRAPGPDRYTILEHLDLRRTQIARAAGRLRRCSP